MSFDEYDVEIENQLKQLRLEHKELDEKIADMLRSGAVDFVEMQRMKKRKLSLKDTISRLESNMLPDILA